MTEMPLKWEQRFLELAQHVATWSRDPSTRVGAVIVDHQRRVVGMGYNGFPRGVRDDEERYAHRPTKYAMVVHAEANAILNSNGPVAGCVIFTTLHPCAECSKLIIQSGIRRLVTHAPSPEERARWGDSFEHAVAMLSEAGVSISLRHVISEAG